MEIKLNNKVTPWTSTSETILAYGVHNLSSFYTSYA